MSKRISPGESPPAAAPPVEVRRSKRGKVEQVASESLEGSAPDVRKPSPLKDRRVTFDPSAQSLSVEEKLSKNLKNVRQIHEIIRQAIDRGMPELLEAIDEIPLSFTPNRLNQNSDKPTFPIQYAIQKLSDQPVPIEVFNALFEAGYRPTNLHLFSLWDTLGGPIDGRDLNSEREALTGLFLTKMTKGEVGKIGQVFWKAILEIQRRELPEDHRGTRTTLSYFEFLIGIISKQGGEKFGEDLILGFKEIAPSDLEEITKIHNFDKKLLDILFRNLTLALDRGAPFYCIRTLVDIICIMDMANPVYTSNLGQSLLLKYLKTPVNLDVLTTLVRIHIQIDPQLLGETMQGCTAEVQALLKEKLMFTV